MEIQYVIINFLILVTILVLVGRKTVKRIFGGRYEKIMEDLDKAEEIEKMALPVSEEFSAEVFAVDLNKRGKQLEQLLFSFLDQV